MQIKALKAWMQQCSSAAHLPLFNEDYFGLFFSGGMGCAYITSLSLNRPHLLLVMRSRLTASTSLSQIRHAWVL